MTSIPKFIPACIGRTMQKEIETITTTLKTVERPFIALIGGLKGDKINTIKNLIGKVDKILMAGGVGFLFLKKSGIDVGNTKVDIEGIEFPDELIHNEKIILPVDAIIANR